MTTAWLQTVRLYKAISGALHKLRLHSEPWRINIITRFALIQYITPQQRIKCNAICFFCANAILPNDFLPTILIMDVLLFRQAFYHVE